MVDNNYGITFYIDWRRLKDEDKLQNVEKITVIMENISQDEIIEASRRCCEEVGSSANSAYKRIHQIAVNYAVRAARKKYNTSEICMFNLRIESYFHIPDYNEREKVKE